MTRLAPLEASGLWKRYGQRQAVRDVSLRVQAGEIRGLLGPNGAGKTTLLRILLGLAQPDRGSVSLLGAPAGVGPLPAGVAGYVDAPGFYPYLSGPKNLALLARLDGARDARAIEARVREAMDQVGLAPPAGQRVSGYSAGMRQRLGLAAAWMRSPRLLLLDEPTSALDPAGARELRAQVRRLAQGGAAVLVSSHDMVEVEGLCDAITVVHHGQVIFSGEIAELRARADDPPRRLRTSDDARASTLATAHPDVRVARAPDGDGLVVVAAGAPLDRYVVALGGAGVAVRSLEQPPASLEGIFLERTAGPAPPPLASSPAAPASRRGHEPGRVRPGGVAAVARVELAKLAAQIKVPIALGACLVGPFALVVAVKVQSTLPDDTLFGRWVKASGFAVPLVVLGFAALWAFPALASVVAGDLFSAEDRHGTWSTLLLRARTRGEVFAGKVVAALAFSVAAVLALTAGSVAAGLLVMGRQPLVGLSGNLLSPGRALGLVALAWASVIPAVLGFSGLSAMLSIATRSGAAGIGLPVLAGFAMELVALLDGPYAVHRLLLTPGFVAWHGLFADVPYCGPLLDALAVSVAYLVGSLAAARSLFLRRDLGG